MHTTGFKENILDGLYYYTIPSFSTTGQVKHGFSSRLGGVSSGACSSLNLGFKRKDTSVNVKNNFELFCQSVGIETKQMVFTDQVHKDRIAIVDERDIGKGFDRESDIFETDGLITNKLGVALVTFYADCVPLFFLDPIKKVIGLSHSGWRGTVAKIGMKTLNSMKDVFGTNPADCLVGIGPSIGSCCFEVDEPVAEEFCKAFPLYSDVLIEPKGNKYYIDLWAANRIQLEASGVQRKNITISSLCTCCNRDTFFSHRGDNGQTGSLAAVLMLT